MTGDKGAKEGSPQPEEPVTATTVPQQHFPLLQHRLQQLLPPKCEPSSQSGYRNADGPQVEPVLKLHLTKTDRQTSHSSVEVKQIQDLL